MSPAYKDFATEGKFREKNFLIIRYGRDHKVWLFMDSGLSCILRTDLKPPGGNKYNRQLSYLLIDNNILPPDRKDLIRLAIMNRFINNSVILR